ncbi:MAG: septum site-determining protein Ssd [Actinomycetes bacterium]
MSNDAELIDEVLRLAAAHAVDVHLATDAEAARGRWSLAPLVLVGSDLVAAVTGLRPPRRSDVVLVTTNPGVDDWQRAVGLGAEHVAVLPDAERWLIDRLADCGEGTPRDGTIVAVIGAGAGAGASTLAAGLALAGAARSLRVLLVDADPVSGGLDVLLGIEDADGVRWRDLAESRGRLSASSLADGLPRVAGVSVLSTDREPIEGPVDGVVPVDALVAVLEAGRRGFDLVVVDVPRNPAPIVDAVTARAHQTVLVTTPHVRSVSAVVRLSAVLQSSGAVVGAVVRGDRGGLGCDAVEAVLPVPVLGSVPHHSSLARRADDGEPPSLRDGYGRACRTLLAALRPSA